MFDAPFSLKDFDSKASPGQRASRTWLTLGVRVSRAEVFNACSCRNSILRTRRHGARLPLDCQAKSCLRSGKRMKKPPNPAYPKKVEAHLSASFTHLWQRMASTMVPCAPTEVPCESITATLNSKSWLSQALKHSRVNHGKDRAML